MMEIIVTILAALLILIGIIGTVIPVVPDMSLIWGVTLGYGLIVGWGESGLWFFAAISLMGIFGIAAEVLAPSAGAKMGGASMWSVVVGVILGIIGLLIFGPLGLVGGTALGTFLMELNRQRKPLDALRAVLGVGLGYGASFLVKLALSLGMAIVWLVWVFVG